MLNLPDLSDPIGFTVCISYQRPVRDPTWRILGCIANDRGVSRHACVYSDGSLIEKTDERTSLFLSAATEADLLCRTVQSFRAIVAKEARKCDNEMISKLLPLCNSARRFSSSVRGKSVIKQNLSHRKLKGRVEKAVKSWKAARKGSEIVKTLKRSLLKKLDKKEKILKKRRKSLKVEVKKSLAKQAIRLSRNGIQVEMTEVGKGSGRKYRRKRRKTPSIHSRAKQAARDVEGKENARNKRSRDNLTDCYAIGIGPIMRLTHQQTRDSCVLFKSRVLGMELHHYLVRVFEAECLPLVVLNEAYSSQCCSVCSARFKCNEKRVFQCSCGHRDDRDSNAAKVLHKYLVKEISLASKHEHLRRLSDKIVNSAIRNAIDSDPIDPREQLVCTLQDEEQWRSCLILEFSEALVDSLLSKLKDKPFATNQRVVVVSELVAYWKSLKSVSDKKILKGNMKELSLVEKKLREDVQAKKKKALATAKEHLLKLLY